MEVGVAGRRTKKLMNHLGGGSKSARVRVSAREVRGVENNRKTGAREAAAMSRRETSVERRREGGNGSGQGEREGS